MFLIALIRYLRGYVRFAVRGSYVERFLNLLARERIPVWEVRRREDRLTACAAAAAYPRMRALAKKAGVRLSLVEKRGLPFKRKKLRRRRGLLVGFGLFALFLFVMSRFIWSIQIGEGNHTVPEERILSALEEIGVRPGVLRSSIDVRDSERRALLALHEFSWIALNIDGSTIHVEVNETMPVPEMIDPDTPCNVVATHDGQILEMRVYSGQPVLQKGDAVLAGQVVISGITQDRLGKNTFKHARADIIAEVSTQLEVRMPLRQITYEETGKTRTRNYIRVFGVDLPFFLPLSVPRPYLAQRGEYPLTLFSAQLPVSRREEVFTLMREVPITYTGEQAKALAMRELAALQEARLPGAQVVERALTGRLEGEEYILTAHLICHINIAREQEILQRE